MDGAGGYEYFLYLRKSKGRAGIARQRNLTTATIERDGGRVIGEFTDEDRTAFQPVGTGRPERPGFDGLLAALAGSARGVRAAAYHADRLSRNSGDAELLTAACAAGDHLVLTHASGTYDLSTSNGRRRFRDDASAAAYEVDRKTEQITDQKREAAAAGLPLGGPRPFGWQTDFRTLHTSELLVTEAEAARRKLDVIRMTETRRGIRALVMVPYSEAAELRAAIEAVAAGTSPGSIAARWNQRGVLTAGGGGWPGGHEVRRIILRPRNAGRMIHHGRDVGPGQWEPAIDDVTWRRACAVIREPRGGLHDWSPRWLGSGIYLCGGCGGVMRAGRAGAPAAPAYRCVTPTVPGYEPDGTRHASRRAAPLDAYVDEALQAWLAGSGAIGRLARAPAEHAAAEADLARIDGELLKLAGQAGDELITAEMLAVAAAPLMARRRALAAARAGQAPDITGTALTGGELWEMAQADLGRKRALLAMTLEVKVMPQPPARRFMPEYVQITSKM
jgi:site-specific DNA recombinase